LFLSDFAGNGEDWLRGKALLQAVFRIRIHMFLGLPDLDPLVRGMDPDPSIIKPK
jgi:hypothetical protein